MILYHGSTVCIEKPEIRQGEVYLDFGVGFYTTTSYEQAERWARIKMRRNNVNVGYVSVYELNLEQTIKKLYDSKLYSILEDEETKVWPYSTDMLYFLLEQEEKNGDILFPDV